MPPANTEASSGTLYSNVRSVRATVDATGERVDILLRRELHREARSPGSVQSFRPVVLRDQQRDVAGAQRHGEQFSLAFMLASDGEAHDIAIPGEAALDVVHRQ